MGNPQAGPTNMFWWYVKERIGKFIHFLEKVFTILFRPAQFAKTIEIGDKKSFSEALDFVFIIISASVLVRLVLSYLLGVEAFAGKAEKLLTLYVFPLLSTILLAAIPYLTLRVFARRRTPLSAYMHCVAYCFAPELLTGLYRWIMATTFAARHELNDALVADIVQGKFSATAPACSEVIKQFDCLVELQQSFLGIPYFLPDTADFLIGIAIACYLFRRVLGLSPLELAGAFIAYAPLVLLLVLPMIAA
jgi:hypothetical protein